MLYSNRIILRAIEENDLPVMAVWRSNPATYEYFYEFLPISARQQKNWYEKQLNDSTEINLIVAKLDGEAIGTVSIYHIDRRNRKAEWGRLLIGNPDWLATGIGCEIEALILEYSFEHLNLNKLYCEVLADNTTAVSLYKKLGFTTEGVLREHVYKSGKHANVLLLSILQREYIKERKSGNLEKHLSKMRSDIRSDRS